jgi:hypothetical protein
LFSFGCVDFYNCLKSWLATLVYKRGKEEKKEKGKASHLHQEKEREGGQEGKGKGKGYTAISASEGS